MNNFFDHPIYGYVFYLFDFYRNFHDLFYRTINYSIYYSIDLDRIWLFFFVGRECGYCQSYMSMFVIKNCPTRVKWDDKNMIIFFIVFLSWSIVFISCFWEYETSRHCVRVQFQEILKITVLITFVMWTTRAYLGHMNNFFNWHLDVDNFFHNSVYVNGIRLDIWLGNGKWNGKWNFFRILYMSS